VEKGFINHLPFISPAEERVHGLSVTRAMMEAMNFTPMAIQGLTSVIDAHLTSCPET
jgi:hypothetical protein